MRTGRTQFAIINGVLGGLGILCFGASATARAETAANVSVDRLRDFVNGTVEQSQTIMDSVANARGALDVGEDGNSGDRATVRDYFQRNRQYYLVNPWAEQKGVIVSAVTDYTSSLDSLVTQARLTTLISGISEEKTNVVLSCFRRKLEDTKNVSSILESTFSNVQSKFAQQIPFRLANSGNEQTRLLGAGGAEGFSKALRDLRTNVGEQARICCESIGLNSERCDQLKSDVNTRNEAAVETLNKKLNGIPDVAQVPDPFRDSRLPAYKMAKFLPLYNFNAIRKGHPDNLNEVAGDESDMFSRAEQSCIAAQRKKQEDSNPIARSIAINVAKGLKCAILPTLATMYLDTEWQRMTTALGATEIKTPGMDLSCDPREMELYNQMRPTDPNIISQQWGLPQLANPPYIDAMRRLPPLQSPFPILPAPGGGIITPYGNIGVTSQSLGAISVNASAANRSSVLPSAARRRVGAARSVPTGSRGLAAGRGLAQGARALSADIAGGVRTRESVTTLKSGASNTRNLAKNILTNTARLSVADRRAAATRSAQTAQTAVRALTGAAGSRTTAQGVLNGLKGRSGSGSSPDNTLEQTLEKKRKQMERLANSYIENIKSAQARAETARLKIIDLIGQRDQISNNVLGEIINKPPRTQAKRVEEARKRILELDKQIGVIKAEYDVYSDSMLESASMIKQLAAFGTQAPNFNGPGGQNDPRKLSTGFPSAPAATGGGRGRTTWMNIFEALLLSRPAWADIPRFGQYADGPEWNAAYDTFVSRVETYAGLKAREEIDARAAALQALTDRSESINLKSASDVDTETLIAMDLYSDALAGESQDLIARLQRNEFSLEAGEVSDLGRIRADALDTQDAIQGIYLLYKDTIPKRAEDNPEAWWGMVEDALGY